MILAVSGYKGAGKTTFIEELLPLLEGYDVIVIKDTHGDVDVKGKDTYRYGEAGAYACAIISDNETAIFFKERASIEKISAMLNADIVLLEGFKESNYPKIWLGDGEGKDVIMKNPSAEEAYSYIVKEVEKEKVLEKLPRIDCGECGHETCNEMADAIVKGKASIGDCKVLKRKGISIKVDGKAVHVNEFVGNMVESVVRGMLSSLKGGEGAGAGEIEIKVSRGNNF